MSARVRAERENCCDDVVVGVCGDAVGYAAALTELATWRAAQQSLSLAATDGSLVARVRRILRAERNQPAAVSGDSVSAAFVMLAVAVNVGARRASADSSLRCGKARESWRTRRIERRWESVWTTSTATSRYT